jgi:hypothetical protein
MASCTGCPNMATLECVIDYPFENYTDVYWFCDTHLEKITELFKHPGWGSIIVNPVGEKRLADIKGNY